MPTYSTLHIPLRLTSSLPQTHRSLAWLIFESELFLCKKKSSLDASPTEMSDFLYSTLNLKILFAQSTFENREPLPQFEKWFSKELQI